MEGLSDRWMYYCGLLAGMGVGVDDLKHIQDLIDAEEQGLLLILPCKVGTPVYSIERDCGGDILDCICMDCEDCRYSYSYVEENAFNTYMRDEIGKTVFLTKEEAKKKLAEMRKE